jgi:hypothetical protein
MAAAGVIAAAVYNSQRSKDSDPLVDPGDFVPRPLREIAHQPAEEEDEGELTIDVLAEFFGARKNPGRGPQVDG